MPVGSIERTRVELAERLRERRPEIEEALLTRTYAIADPKEASDPEYVQGLRAAVSAALDFGLAAVEHGEERAPQAPVLLLAQARLAARNGVPLDTVLRRYFAGYTLLGDFIVQEAGAVKLGEAALKCLLREQAALLDRFLAAVAEEHGRERETSHLSPEQRQAKRIERLLDGELVDISGISYDFDARHLAVVGSGSGAAGAIRELAHALDLRLLLFDRDEESAVWAWLGARRLPEIAEVQRMLSFFLPTGSRAALGEPREGIMGFRLTHRQAKAALPVALRSADGVVRYGHVPLLAAALQDDLLALSLRDLYLTPLADRGASGSTLCETLRTYFRAGRNVSSAAAALNVSRQTIRNRIQIIEERLGQTLDSCGLELEFALQLEGVDAISFQSD